MNPLGKINVLDFEVANLIAAGEVVDRPCSCVKELLENAVDAGSSVITAEIQRGGVAFIRISDNGCGMEKEDLPSSILRHATSKIKTAADLSGIETLGFRGEALAAISSVSRIRILSKIPGMDFGAMLEAEGGEIVEFCETGCADGTTVIVEDLFYNVPARRKFLKKDSTEATACSTVVEKIALSHPEIAVKFISDGEVKFITSGNGKLRETVHAIYGREIARRSLRVDREEDGVRISGYISEPDMSRNTRNMENFFINGRYVKSRTAAAAVEQAYSSKSQAEKFPFCALNIEINPAVVDVNVHPAKLEVKFTNEKLIFDAVYYAVQTALEAEPVRPELKLGETLGKENPGKGEKASPYRVTDYRNAAGYRAAGGTVQTQCGTVQTQYGAAKTQCGTVAGARGALDGRALKNAFVPQDKPLPKSEQLRISAEAYRNAAPRETVEKSVVEGRDAPISPSPGTLNSPTSNVSSEKYSPENASQENPSPEKDSPEKAEEKTAPLVNDAEKSLPAEAVDSAKLDYVILGEAYNCYIIVQLEDRLLMIDKHAAHERIIFDELCRKVRRATHSGQLLLVPRSVSLLCSEAEAVEEYAENIRAMGFDFHVGRSEVAQIEYELTQIPEELTVNEAVALFADLAGRLSDVTATVESASAEFFESRLWQSACKAAIKGGRKYDDAHLKWLCDRLLVKPENGGSVIRTCPHGRPVAFEIKKSSIERQFARIQ